VAPERNRVVVSFVDAETGTVLETFDSNDLKAHEAPGPTTTPGEAPS
jgi:hypothetical protein